MFCAKTFVLLFLSLLFLPSLHAENIKDDKIVLLEVSTSEESLKQFSITDGEGILDVNVYSSSDPRIAEQHYSLKINFAEYGNDMLAHILDPSLKSLTGINAKTFSLGMTIVSNGFEINSESNEISLKLKVLQPISTDMNMVFGAWLTDHPDKIAKRLPASKKLEEKTELMGPKMKEDKQAIKNEEKPVEKIVKKAE